LKKLKSSLAQGGVSLLLAAGVVLPCLFALGLEKHLIPALCLMAGATLVCVLARLNKWTAFTLPLLLAAGGVLAFLPSVTEAGRALLLKFAGQSAALPLYTLETALILSAAAALAAYPLCSRSAGFYPALTLCLAVLMSLWLTGRQTLLWYAAPALMALVALYARSHHWDLKWRAILPLSAVLVAAALLLTPSQGLVYEPFKDAADKLRQAIYDRFFFTEPRNIFSLASQGYYPKGANQLGGPAEPSDEPVMQVAAPQKVYLRGTLFNEYTGRVWLNTTGGHRYRYEDLQWRGLRTQLFDMDLPSGSLSQAAGLFDRKTVQVKMVNSSASTLFAPQRVRELRMAKGDMVGYFNNASELFITRDLAPDDEYTVTAPLLTAGSGGLGTVIDGCARQEDSRYAQILADYTRLPEHMEQQVFDLVDKVIGGAAAPYEKALAIQNYLSRYYRYTLTPEAEPDNVDFVSYFLLRGKEGYCTYFASAMTVMCRMAGLPARYVEGFLAQPTANGVAYVTGESAHAWTEVYFPGFGWLTFDATPSQQSQTEEPPQDEPETPQATPTPAPEEPEPTPPPREPEAHEEPEDEPPLPPDEPDPKDTPPFPWWVLAVLAFIAALILRFRFTAPAGRVRAAKDDEGRVMAWAQAVYDLLKLRGFTPLPHETPYLFTLRVDEQGGFTTPLVHLGEVLSLCRYSPHPVLAEDADTAREACLGLYNAQPWHVKLRFHCLRAFTTPKMTDFTKR